MRRILSRRTLQGILLLFLLLTLPYFLLLTRHQANDFVLLHPYFTYDLDIEEPRSSGQTCVLPRIHPFHPSIWGYLSAPKLIYCKSRRADLTYIDSEGRLKFNESEVLKSGYKVGNSLRCYWSPVLRGGADEDDDDTVSYGKEELLPLEGTAMTSQVDIVRVICRNFASVAVYDKIHAHIRNASSPVSPDPPIKNPLNVLIFGLDSMSRLAFIRLLPLTYRYLTEELKMTILRGMNKVGDNTYPNLIAMLTGHKAYGGGLPDYSDGFDEWPLIWRNFSSAGYATMFAEDFPEYGLFTYLATGFREIPTMHYLRPFWLAIQKSHLLKISSHMCYGSKPTYLFQMDYVRRFMAAYERKKIPYFGFSFLAELSHEYVSRIGSADSHFRDFFRDLQDSGFLKNTLLIVMSDHGHRFDAIRTTQVGHIEERLPFFSLRLPDSMPSPLHPTTFHNLNLNSARLITPFDVYATLSDLLGYINIGRPLGKSPSPPGTLGLSLFGEIPSNRTCSGASIPVHYCTCETESSIPTSDTRVTSAAVATIRQINRLLADGGPDIYNRCSHLTMGSIKTSHLVHSENSETSPGQRIRVVLEVEPSKGIFEATVSVRDENFEVLGDVSRINPYGDQASCIRHPILRKYCFCSSNISHKASENDVPEDSTIL